MKDEVLIAYQWLDAQTIIKTKQTRGSGAAKHIIENWAGRHIGYTDVIEAGKRHPKIQGQYPLFNISARLTEPRISRLDSVESALTQMNYRELHDLDDYSKFE